MGTVDVDSGTCQNRLQLFVERGWYTHVKELLHVSSNPGRRRVGAGPLGKTAATLQAQLNDRYGPQKRTVLHMAVSHENSGVALSMTKLLVSHEASPLVKDRHGQEPLSLACSLGRSRVADYLIKECDLSLSTQDDDGRTPLAHAVLSGDVDCVRLMVSELSMRRALVHKHQKQTSIRRSNFKMNP